MDYSVPPGPVVQVLNSASEEQLVAVMEVMHFVAKADGFLSADELREFLKFAKAVTSGKLDSKRLSILVSGWGKRDVDVEARLRELSTVLETVEYRRATYDLAQRMATVDGRVDDKEMVVLELIESSLDIR